MRGTGSSPFGHHSRPTEASLGSAAGDSTTSWPSNYGRPTLHPVSSTNANPHRPSPLGLSAGPDRPGYGARFPARDNRHGEGSSSGVLSPLGQRSGPNALSDAGHPSTREANLRLEPASVDLIMGARRGDDERHTLCGSSPVVNRLDLLSNLKHAAVNGVLP
jgi:hypothetical protein